MGIVKTRNLIIGQGRPKICVPVVGVTIEDIRRQAEEAMQSQPDLIEWRMDWYEKGTDAQAVIEVLPVLREILGETPLLATFRTDGEGGEKAIDPDTYTALNTLIAASGYIDLVDVQLSMSEESVREIVAAAHLHRVKVVMSNHDFYQTPPKDEMIRRLLRMEKLGADIPKIAVMPECTRDVLTLLDVTLTMKEQYGLGPIVTMAMSKKGLISRLSGEIFGSAITFGSAGKASAPGQIEVSKLRTVLDILSESME